MAAGGGFVKGVGGRLPGALWSCTHIWYVNYMKTITVNVSELVYEEFQDFAKRHGRTAAELIREAMETYSRSAIRSGTSLRDLQPLNLGRVLAPLSAEDDLLDEMLA